MKNYTVKDLMITVSDYATVSEDANLFEAVASLEKAQVEFDKNQYPHRAILVYDKNQKIVGKLSMVDALVALEPGYRQIGDPGVLSRAGFSPEFVMSLRSHYSLWDRPLADICRKATEMRVKDFMYTPTEGEYVSEEATLDDAIHQIVVGHHQSLIVTRGDDIVGILRLVDVFHKVWEAVKECHI